MFHFNEELKATDKSRQLIRKAFTYGSSSKDKCSLNKTDFKVAWLYLFGYKISKYDLKEYFEKLNKDYYKDTIIYDEFEKKALGEIKRLDVVEELRNAFIAIDFSCKGFLTMDDFLKQFNLISPKLPHNTIVETFRELDRDEDNRVSYKDFELAMLYNDEET